MELPDGTLLMSIRGRGHRRIAESTDGGNTWSEPREVPELVEPGCNGDILAYTTPSGKQVLLQSIPNTTPARNDRGTARENITVFVSEDGGKTWPRRKTVVRSEGGYSAMTVLANGDIGMLIEEGWWEDWGVPGDNDVHASNPGFDIVFHRLSPAHLGLGQDE